MAAETSDAPDPSRSEMRMAPPPESPDAEGVTMNPSRKTLNQQSLSERTAAQSIDEYCSVLATQTWMALSALHEKPEVESFTVEEQSMAQDAERPEKWNSPMVMFSVATMSVPATLTTG